MALFIGIDSGTQSTKVVLVGGDGRVIAACSVAHRMLPATEAGQKEQDPQEWIDAAAQAIGRVLEDAPVDRADVAAIGISGQQHGLVALDAGDRVIRPAKLWCDTTTAREAEEIVGRLGGLSRSIELLGNAIPTGFTAPKILWLKEHEPAGYARLATVLLPHDYLAFWLTGRKTMEPGDASGTGLMDVRARAWRREAIEAIDPALEAALPPLQPSSDPAGTVRADLARRWGFGSEVLVSGSGDNMMGAVGTGSVRPGVVSASFGTSGTIYACSETPIVDPEGEIAAFCDATGRWLPLACTMNVTVATGMTRRWLGLDREDFDRAAASARAGSDGLLLIPFFEGERTPNCPDGTGVWFGVREATFDAAHMARAAMEGVTLGMNYGLNRLRELGVVPSEIRLTGGGARSAVWRQIAADVFDCPVVGLEQEEGAACGAALHAMWVLERARRREASIEDIAARLVRLDERTRAVPDAERAGVYRSLQRLFDRAASDLGASFTLHRRFVAESGRPR